MFTTDDGYWQLAEATDSAVGFYDPPALCLRCGISVSAVSPRARALHDAFHVRVGQ